MFRTLSLLLAVVALTCFFATPALAEKKADAEGTVVKAEGNTVVVKDKDNKEATWTLASDAKVTCDGKECKASDLKPGVKVKATLNADKKVSKLEASTK